MITTTIMISMSVNPRAFVLNGASPFGGFPRTLNGVPAGGNAQPTGGGIWGASGPVRLPRGG
jgi:hypothetical protein